MINSALTLNQKPFAMAPPPPDGLVTLGMPEGPATPGAPNAVTGDVTSCARRRRMSSVISSEPIQMRRVWSMLMTLASAFSCSAVHTRAGPGWAAGAGAQDQDPAAGQSG